MDKSCLPRYASSYTNQYLILIYFIRDIDKNVYKSAKKPEFVQTKCHKLSMFKTW